jgi:hypothetical protein
MNFVVLVRHFQHVLDRPVDFGRSTSAALVRGATRVTDASQDQTVFHSIDRRLVSRQPGDRPDCPRHEHEAVGMVMMTALKVLRHIDGSGDARQIVVAERGVTAVTRDENLVITCSFEKGFAVRQVTVDQRAVDAHLVRVLLECQ